MIYVIQKGKPHRRYSGKYNWITHQEAKEQQRSEVQVSNLGELRLPMLKKITIG